MKKHLQNQFLKSNEDLTLEDILNYSKSSSPVKMVSKWQFSANTERQSNQTIVGEGIALATMIILARKITKKSARFD